MEKEGIIEDLVPEVIIFQVLKELPTKSLIRFRSVSRQWQSIIDDPHFVYSHHTRSNTGLTGVEFLVYHFPSEEVNFKFDVLFTDQDGGSSIRFMMLEDDCINYKSLHLVNGLVYMGNRIWNPTTKETSIFHLIEESSSKDVILAFEVGVEKFRIIWLPADAEQHHMIQFYVIQLGGSLALRDRGAEKMWILEDYDKQQWRRETLVIPNEIL